jgi:hypothetical protein
LTSEKLPLNLAGAALVPGLGIVNVDNFATVGIIPIALDDKYDGVVLGTIDDIPLANVDDIPLVNVDDSVYDGVW